MNRKAIGASLLLAGTAIGAGMLGMPFVSGVCGYHATLVVMFFCFSLMLANLFLLLEATLYCKDPNVNIIGMAREHLSKTWSYICWVSFMLLLYSILASYMSAGGDMISYLFIDKLGIPINKNWSILIFNIFFGIIILLGVESIDRVNRIFMLGLLSAFFIVVYNMFPLSKLSNLSNPGDLIYIPRAIPIITAAFTSHLILPSLKSYLSNTKVLRNVLFYGSLIPLFLYLIWQTIVLSIIQPSGPLSIHVISASPQPIYYFFSLLEQKKATSILIFTTQLFFFCAITTSFLGVLLSLIDFLKDGLNLRKHSFNNAAKTLGLALIPPYLFTLTLNAAFTYALNFAALFIAILYAIIPGLVVLKCRDINNHIEYILPGGRVCVHIIILFGTVFAVLSLMSVYNILPYAT
tara:strand:+ start:2349 stop:3569 length:1221 start_codon:yes stop_codon:yes gene_type:complete